MNQTQNNIIIQNETDLKNANKKKRTYNLQFWLLCISSSFFFVSFNMMIPELPAYLETLGGADYKGYIIGLFTIAAGISRPYSGRLTDKVGRIPVMVYGALVCLVLGFVYPMVTTVWGFLILRFFHGMSTGFKPTGTAAYVADIVPENKRGEAMGLLGVFGITAGMALGPQVGDFFVRHYGVNVMFYMSGVFALLSVLVLFGMKETLPNKESLRRDHLKITRSDIFEPRVIAPTIVMVLMAYNYGVILTVIQDFSQLIGFENKGAFFTSFSISALLVRIIGGKLSDKYGRVKVLIFVTLIAIIPMVILANTRHGDFIQFGIAAFTFGIAAGMYSPVLFAWAIDLADSKHKGRAMSTVYIALELGIMIGAFLSANIYDNVSTNFPKVFYLSAILPFLAFIYLVQLKGKSRI